MSQKQYHGESLFMQLEDWVVDILMSDQMTKTDHRLFWYLFKLERWGDKFVDLPSQAEIALQLGVRRETINQSQAKLQKLGLWDFKITGWKARNLVGPKSNRVLEKSNTLLDEAHSQLDSDRSQLEKSNTNIYKDRARAESFSDYSDFIKTLSDSERESFEKFVREEWRKLKGEEVVSLERFLSREEDIKNWYEKFLMSSVGRAAKEEAIATQFDWRNDPRFDDWIWKAFNEGYLWTQSDEAEREQRHAFLRWAQTTNAYKGVCY